MRNFVCDDGDCHHHFFKLEFAIFQAVLQVSEYFHIKIPIFPYPLGKRIAIFLLPEAFCGLKYAENAIAAGVPPRTLLGGGAHDAPPDLLVGWGADILLIPNPTRRLWLLDARAFCASIVVPLDTKSWRRRWSPPLLSQSCASGPRPIRHCVTRKL